VLSALRRWVEMERDGDASAPMCGRLAPWLLPLKWEGVPPRKEPHPRVTASPLSLEERAPCARREG
jgi:hypothetical protein